MTRADKERLAAKQKAYDEWKRSRDESISTVEKSTVDMKLGTIKIGDDVRQVGDHDAFVWLREDGKPCEIICKMPEVEEGNVLHIKRPFLIAFGLQYLLSDQEWLDKLIERTKVKLEEKLKPYTKE